MAPQDMPSGTTYGTITGDVSSFIGDTDADTNDLPDRVPASGTVTFTPSVAYVVHSSGALILAPPETVRLDASGRFTAKLVATDSPDLQPSGWYYSVKVDVGQPTVLSGQVKVAGGATVTLGQAIGAAQAGTAIVKVEGPRGPEGPAGPRGPEGPAGPRGPAGPAGDPTLYELRGAGTPEGVVTASPGTYYTDTAGTNGAWRWIKESGTGATGWDVVDGDTGWLDLSPYLVNGAMKGGGTPGSEPSKIRRSGNVVHFIGSFSLPPWTSGQSALTFPRMGFTAPSGGGYMPTGYAQPPQAVLATVAMTHEVRLYTSSADIGNRYQWTWLTDDPWPTTLP